MGFAPVLEPPGRNDNTMDFSLPLANQPRPGFDLQTSGTPRRRLCPVTLGQGSKTIALPRLQSAKLLLLEAISQRIEHG